MATQIELLTGLVNVAIPSVYQKGMSYYEVLTAVVNKVNELIEQSNEYFSEDIKVIIEQILTTWYDDGLFDTIIADTLSTGLTDLETEVGDISGLTTDVTSSIVAALNDVNDSVETLDRSTHRVFNVVAYGATGENIANDTTALTNALAAAAAFAGDSIVYIPPIGKDLYIDTTLVVPSGVNFIMDNPIRYVGGLYEPAIEIANDSDYLFSREYKINVVNDGVSDWENENSIGVIIKNANTCKINIHNVVGFTIGAQFIGISKGFAYNTIHLGNIKNNKYGLDLTNISNGWINENLFLGGRFWNDSVTHPTKTRYGVRIDSQDGLYTNNNNNNFYKPSFELAKAATNEAYPVLIEYGSYNRFIHYRNEGNSVENAIINNGSDNIFEPGFGAGNISDLSDNKTNIVTQPRNNIYKQRLSTVFNTGRIIDRACDYNGTGSVNVAGLFLASSSNAVLLKSASSVYMENGYISMGGTRGVGIRLTRGTGKFIVNRSYNSGFPGRVNIRCYDSAGVLLTSSDPNHPYVFGEPQIPLSWSTSFGGVYRQGSDSGSPIIFTLHEDVAFIDVILSGGTAVLELIGFNVQTVGQGNSVAYSTFDNDTFSVATAPPTDGTYQKGRIIYNDNPSSASPIGWVCTVGGTPGTWAGFGIIS